MERRQVIDTLRLAPSDLNLAEAGLVEFADEVVLGQGSGRAAGPGSRMGEHFGREVVVLDGHVGDAQLRAGPEHPPAWPASCRSPCFTRSARQ